VGDVPGGGDDDGGWPTAGDDASLAGSIDEALAAGLATEVGAGFGPKPGSGSKPESKPVVGLDAAVAAVAVPPKPLPNWLASATPYREAAAGGCDAAGMADGSAKRASAYRSCGGATGAAGSDEATGGGVGDAATAAVADWNWDGGGWTGADAGCTGADAVCTGAAAPPAAGQPWYEPTWAAIAPDEAGEDEGVVTAVAAAAGGTAAGGGVAPYVIGPGGVAATIAGVAGAAEGGVSAGFAPSSA